MALRQHVSTTRLLAILAFTLGAPLADAGTFLFGGNANGLDGLTAGVATASDFSMQIASTIGVLSERGGGGLGIDTRGLTGFVGGELDKFDIIQGSTPLAGEGESITFYFDRPGVITGLDFDGVKDESLEYFVLRASGGRVFEVFDSAANVSVPGAVDAAVTAGVVRGEVIYLREDGPLDDELAGLSIPFAAGELFTLTYQELGDAFGPLEPGNGARFQGITVEAVPEPHAASLALLAIAGMTRRHR